MADYVSIHTGATIDAAISAVPNKVDAEVGKGLSEANFTNAEKAQLAATIPATTDQVNTGTNDTAFVTPLKLQERLSNGFGTAAEFDVGTGVNDIPQNSDLGTAAYQDTTTSPTDTTAGRLLKVGDFGLGQNISLPFAGSDLNTLRSVGFYLAESSLTSNLPPFTGTYSVVVFHANSNVRTMQQAALQDVENPRIFQRVLSSIGWSSWREVYTQGNILGTVSQSGGVPTGAIIERGSNANGEYVKFADGTVDMYITRTFNSTAISTAYGSLFRSTGLNLTLPVSLNTSFRIGASCGNWADVEGNAGYIIFTQIEESQILGAILVSAVSTPSQNRTVFLRVTGKAF